MCPCGLVGSDQSEIQSVQSNLHCMYHQGSRWAYWCDAASSDSAIDLHCMREICSLVFHVLARIALDSVDTLAFVAHVNGYCLARELP